jgi:hypothetical protein
MYGGNRTALTRYKKGMKMPRRVSEIPANTVRRVFNHSKRMRKMWAVADAITRPEGGNCMEICEANGFVRISIEKQARYANIKWRMEGNGTERRYFAV